MVIYILLGVVYFGVSSECAKALVFFDAAVTLPSNPLSLYFMSVFYVLYIKDQCAELFSAYRTSVYLLSIFNYHFFSESCNFDFLVGHDGCLQ